MGCVEGVTHPKKPQQNQVNQAGKATRDKIANKNEETKTILKIKKD